MIGRTVRNFEWEKRSPSFSFSRSGPRRWWMNDVIRKVDEQPFRRGGNVISTRVVVGITCGGNLTFPLEPPSLNHRRYPIPRICRSITAHCRELIRNAWLHFRRPVPAFRKRDHVTILYDKKKKRVKLNRKRYRDAESRIFMVKAISR